MKTIFNTFLVIALGAAMAFILYAVWQRPFSDVAKYVMTIFLVMTTVLACYNFVSKE